MPQRDSKMRSIGVDLGTVRIGIALSDGAGLIATPYEVLQRSGALEDDHRKIAELVRSVDGEVVVVGLPLSLDGNENQACRQAREEAASIAACLNEPDQPPDTQRPDTQSPDPQPSATQPPTTQPPTTQPSATQPPEGEPTKRQEFSKVRVVLHDERFTTVEAERSLSQQKLRGPTRRKKRRQVVDKVAATVLLQSWLDSQ